MSKQPLMNPSQTEFLYRAEVKGIQAWILASDRLRELVGGSALIEGLCDGPSGGDVQALVDVTGGKVETAAAGNVELRFTTRDSLQRFAAAWPLVVAARAPGLQVIQAWAPTGGDEDAARHVLFGALGAVRNRLDAELPEVGPLVARAGRTGLPAVGRSDKGRVTKRAPSPSTSARGTGTSASAPSRAATTATPRWTSPSPQATRPTSASTCSASELRAAAAPRRQSPHPHGLKRASRPLKVGSTMARRGMPAASRYTGATGLAAWMTSTAPSPTSAMGTC